MKSIILIPFAYDENKQSGVNLSANVNKRDIYLKNICVALVSAKHNNPESDVAMVTNIEVPQQYAGILRKNNIKQLRIPFDMFLFDDNYRWALAFYKLCAIYHIAREFEYDYYCYLDSDVYVQNSISHIWKECEQNILLYDVNAGLQDSNYQTFISELQNFQINEYSTLYGGEFFAANRENAIIFSQKCLEVFEKMRKQSFITTQGDEFILSLAAREIKSIKNAGAYVYRFWTGDFRMISTNYIFNEVPILHVPSEKGKGMITLFEKYIKKGCPVSKNKVHRILRLKSPRLKTRIKHFFKSDLGNASLK